MNTNRHFAGYAYRNWYWRGTTVVVVAVIRERTMMRE